MGYIKLSLFFAIAIVCCLTASTANAASAPCSACHADVAQAFASKPHGRALDSEDAGDAACAGCHGDGSAHVAAPSSATSITRFRDEPASEIAATCGSCHEDVHTTPLNPHAGAGLTCTDCHSIHHEPERSPLPGAWQNLDAASANCYECHQDTFTQFKFNEGHRLAQGAVSCTSCHDAHAPAAGMRLGGFKDALCDSCHADKSGPFVFEHAATRVEGCGACHTPHGSPNRHMLTHQQTGELCYTCHAGVPQFHLGFSPVAPARFDERTVCTNCHVTIHGSNLDRNFLR